MLFVSIEKCHTSTCVNKGRTVGNGTGHTHVFELLLTLGYSHREHACGRNGSTMVSAGHWTHIFALMGSAVPGGAPNERISLTRSSPRPTSTVAKPVGHVHKPPLSVGFVYPVSDAVIPQLMHCSPSDAGVSAVVLPTLGNLVNHWSQLRQVSTR